MATVNKRRWANKSGSHEAWVLAFTDAAGKRHKEQFQTKRAADARRVEVEGQVSKGAYREQAAKLTVSEACKRYLQHLVEREERGERVTPTYLVTTRAELENYVLAKPRDGREAKFRGRATAFSDGIAHIKLAHLTPGDVSDLAERLRKAGVSVTSTRRAIAALSRALAYAVTKNLVASNVARGVKVIGTRKEGPQRIVPPSKSELASLLKSADEETRFRIQFAALTGLRASEQWALRWKNVDLVGRTISVVERLDKYGQLDTTKSAAGTRSVPVSTALAGLLKTRRGGASADELVFPVIVTRNGLERRSYVNHGNFTKRTFGPLVAAAELGADFGWHSLRHFAVSTWIEDGRPPKTVQTWAGHATLAITMDRYGHLFPSEQHQSAMDRIAGGILGQATVTPVNG